MKIPHTGSRNSGLSLVDLQASQCTRTSQDQRGTHFKRITATFSQAFCLIKRRRGGEKNHSFLSSANRRNFILSFPSNQRVCRHVTFSLLGNRNNTTDAPRQHELFRRAKKRNKEQESKATRQYIMHVFFLFLNEDNGKRMTGIMKITVCCRDKKHAQHEQGQSRRFPKKIKSHFTAARTPGGNVNYTQQRAFHITLNVHSFPYRRWEIVRCYSNRTIHLALMDN